MFENIEFDYEKYKDCTFDIKDKDPEVLVLVEEVENKFIEGKSKNAIIKALEIEFDIKREIATKLADRCYKDYVKSLKVSSENSKEKNILRLERVYTKAMAEDDLRNAISAVDKINKLCGNYTENVSVEGKSFKLNFGGDE